MSAQYKIAMIGCGRPRGTDKATGFGMAHRHMAGYKQSGKCKLVAVADLSEQNAQAFVKEWDPAARTYADYAEMMRREKPDVVSVCLWPHLHAQVVCDIAALGPRAIHCEKPMDVHWDAALRMQAACEKAGVQLTINHQRRYNKPFLKAKELLDAGAVGRIQRMDAAWHNFADSGTHWLDMLFYFNNETPAQWALGQVDIRGARRVFGALNEGQGVVTFHCENGVRATMFSGKDHADLGCFIRVSGDKGVLEITTAEPWLRVDELDRPGWQRYDTGESIHDDAAIYRGIDNLLECLETGATPLLSSKNALRATEIIFAAYESSRRRARVDLPLPPGPSALLEMVKSGEMEYKEG